MMCDILSCFWNVISFGFYVFIFICVYIFISLFVFYLAFLCSFFHQWGERVSFLFIPAVPDHLFCSLFLPAFSSLMGCL